MDRSACRQCQADWTISAVSLRTSGSSTINTGKATTHERPHEPSQICRKFSSQPTPRADASRAKSRRRRRLLESMFAVRSGRIRRFDVICAVYVVEHERHDRHVQHQSANA